jgi:hypothetical protein
MGTLHRNKGIPSLYMTGFTCENNNKGESELDRDKRIFGTLNDREKNKAGRFNTMNRR